MVVAVIVIELLSQREQIRAASAFLGGVISTPNHGICPAVRNSPRADAADLSIYCFSQLHGSALRHGTDRAAAGGCLRGESGSPGELDDIIDILLHEILRSESA